MRKIKQILQQHFEKRKHLSPADRASENVLYYLGLVACFALLLFLVFRISFPPCAFYYLTGYYCPGCGGTRAISALLTGQIVRSFLYHPLILYICIFGGWFMISQTIERLSKRQFLIGMNYHSIYLFIALALSLIHALALDLLLLVFHYDFLTLI